MDSLDSSRRRNNIKSPNRLRPGGLSPGHWSAPSAETIETIANAGDQLPPKRNYVVVVIHYEAMGEVVELVDSIRHWDEQPECIHIVDNSHPRYPWPNFRSHPVPVKVLPSPGNPGYGQAANIGVFASPVSTPYALILTQEARLEATAIARLLDTIQSDSSVAVAAPALVFRSDPNKYFSLGGTLSSRGVASHIAFRQNVSDVSPDALRTRTVDWVDGSCLLIRTDVFRALSGFDPRYFMYAEEIDYQLRVRLAGRVIRIVQTATGLQEPGTYTMGQRYRSHLMLTKKFYPMFGDLPIWHFLIRPMIVRIYKWLTLISTHR